MMPKGELRQKGRCLIHLACFAWYPGKSGTPEQMKMALTRLGFGSKIVVTGDISQIDLPRGESGLVQVRSVLEGIDDIAFCDLSGKDVVRHSLVATIVAAYERAAGKAR